MNGGEAKLQVKEYSYCGYTGQLFTSAAISPVEVPMVQFCSVDAAYLLQTQLKNDSTDRALDS